MPAEVTKMVPMTQAATTPATSPKMMTTQKAKTSTQAPPNVESVDNVDEPEFGAASIIDDNKKDVIEQDAKEQIGTIPLWVWILVAIIGVVVILCIVLVITRCVRRSSGRTIYKDPLQSKIDF